SRMFPPAIPSARGVRERRVWKKRRRLGMSTFHPLRPFQALHPLQPLCAEVLRDGEVERAGVERRGGEAEADLAGVVRVDGAEEAAPARALDRHVPVVEAA